MKSQVQNMKSIRISALLALPLFLVTAFVWWHASPTTGPHGGILKKSGDHYIEMKNPENYFYAYLLDKKMKTISNKNMFADVRFFMPDSTTIDIKLTPGPGNSFTTKSMPGFIACKVSFKIGTTEISATFENQSQIAELKNK